MINTIFTIVVSLFFSFFMTSNSLAEENLNYEESTIDIISEKKSEEKSEEKIKSSTNILPTAEDVTIFINKAKSYLGVPYLMGGKDPSKGLDCSGFVKLAIENSLGMVVPRTAIEISKIGEKILKSELKPGDLVFFNTRKKEFSHVGIYIGNSKFIHSPRKGYTVTIDNMNQSYWTTRFNGARRIMK